MIADEDELLFVNGKDIRYLLVDVFSFGPGRIT